MKKTKRGIGITTRWVLAFSLFYAAAVAAAPLDIVTVGAPAINCKFDTDCTITVTDSSDHFTIGPTTGDAFLQSRTWPPGESSTAAEGLYGYMYRLDLRQLAGLTALPCINQFTIDFGPVTPLDYNDDGNNDDVWVVTNGGLGTVGPSSAEKTGDSITFSFNPPVCAGSSPGNGESSYFFGLTSTRQPRGVEAQVRDTLGGSTDLDARAPELLLRFFARPWWWLAIVVVLVIVGGLVWAARRKKAQAR